MAPHPWAVIVKPVDMKVGSVESGGVAVVLTDGEEERETTRVAFDRSLARDPERDFETALTEEITKAELAAEKVNDLLDDFDRLHAEAVEKAKEAIKEALGRPPVWNAKPV